jgi:hypothetical protein
MVLAFFGAGSDWNGDAVRGIDVSGDSGGSSSHMSQSAPVSMAVGSGSSDCSGALPSGAAVVASCVVVCGAGDCGVAIVGADGWGVVAVCCSGA